jgi:undecaprenyl-diphosphatase
MDFGAWYMGFREWLIQHPDAILISIFLVSLIEAVAVIGVIVPAVPMLFVLCVLAAHADVPLLHLFIAGIAGAMMGDGISYSFGHGFKHRIHHFWPFSRYPHWLEHSEDFVKRHGGKGVIFGRFIGPLRAFVPMAAGIFQMKPVYFLWMNFLSALVWAPFHLLPGYSLGAATAHDWLPGRSQLLFIGAILIVAAVLTWLLPALDSWRHRRAQANPLPNQGLFFSIDGHPEDQRSTLLLAGFSFISVILIVLLHPWLEHGDHQFLQWLITLRQGSLDMLLVSLTLLSGKTGLLVFGSVFIGWLLLRGEWSSAGIFTLAAFACLSLPFVLQVLISHPRPNIVELSERSRTQCRFSMGVDSYFFRSHRPRKVGEYRPSFFYHTATFWHYRPPCTWHSLA